MNYYKPKEVISPKDAITDIVEILDDGDSSISLAKMKWYGKEVFGIRWNVGMKEWNDEEKKKGKKCLGVPTSHAKPTWFILPNEILDKNSELLQKIENAMKWYFKN